MQSLTIVILLFLYVQGAEGLLSLPSSPPESATASEFAWTVFISVAFGFLCSCVVLKAIRFSQAVTDMQLFLRKAKFVLPRLFSSRYCEDLQPRAPENLEENRDGLSAVTDQLEELTRTFTTNLATFTTVLDGLKRDHADIEEIRGQLRTVQDSLTASSAAIQLDHVHHVALNAAIQREQIQLSQMVGFLENDHHIIGRINDDLRNDRNEIAAIGASLQNDQIEILNIRNLLLDEQNQIQQIRGNLRNDHVAINDVRNHLQADHDAIVVIQNNLQRDHDTIAVVRDGLQEDRNIISTIKNDLQAEHNAIVGIRTDLGHDHEDILRIRRDLQNDHDEVNALRIQLQGDHNEIDAIRNDLQHDHENILTIIGNLQNDHNAIDTLRHVIDEVSTSLRQDHDAIDAIKNELENEQNGIGRIRQNLQADCFAIHDTSDGLAGSRRELQLNRSDIAVFLRDLNNNKTEIMDVVHQLNQLKEDQDAISRLVTSLEKECSHIHELRSDLFAFFRPFRDSLHAEPSSHFSLGTRNMSDEDDSRNDPGTNSSFLFFDNEIRKNHQKFSLVEENLRGFASSIQSALNGYHKFLDKIHFNISEFQRLSEDIGNKIHSLSELEGALNRSLADISSEERDIDNQNHEGNECSELNNSDIPLDDADNESMDAPDRPNDHLHSEHQSVEE